MEAWSTYNRPLLQSRAAGGCALVLLIKFLGLEMISNDDSQSFEVGFID